MGRTNYKFGHGNSLRLTGAVSCETAIRFKDMCERRGQTYSEVIRDLVEGAVAADKFVYKAIGEYEGTFEVDILLPDVDAAKMTLQCSMRARLNQLKELEDEGRGR